MRVCALIVTRNRKNLLEEVLQGLKHQKRPPEAILVVDNASTDGTSELLSRVFPEVHVLRLPENLGGAMGFSVGMRWAVERRFDWVWVMDDDTVPTSEALERLFVAAEHLKRENPAVLASRVLWVDGSLHPMNYPWPKPLPIWRYLRFRSMGFPPIRWAAYSSVLIATWALERYGFPCPEFFVRTDDLEHTGRILRHEKGFWVLNSIAIHKTPTKYTPASAHPERFFYEVRNRIWAAKGPAYSPLEKALLILHLLGSTLDYLRHTGWNKGWPIIKEGVKAGFTTAPDWKGCGAQVR